MLAAISTSAVVSTDGGRYDGDVSPRRRHVRLATRVLLLQMVIILVTLVAGFIVSVVEERHKLDHDAGERSLQIAHAVAAVPAIATAFSAPDPAAVIDPIVERIRRVTGAAFIVVTNRDGVRYSHPNPALIGKSLLGDPGEDPRAVLNGEEFVGVQNGSLGRSMRAKVPLRDRSGKIIGMVSVGVLEAKVSSELRHDLPTLFVPTLVGLVIGVAGAFTVASRVKRQTFGLEPAEIASLLEQREAMLHGIREGALTLDDRNRLTMINDEAARLLQIDDSMLGRDVGELFTVGGVRDVLLGRVDGRDHVVVVADRVLVVNRTTVQVHGRTVGAIVTLRDRTELEHLLHELDDVRGLAETLRAQEHEFANRLHVISGLIELGQYDEAVSFINRSSRLHQELAASLVERGGDPVLSALLLGKAAVASERGIVLRVSARSELPERLPQIDGIVTIVGNLIDNAFESVQQNGTGGFVDVTLETVDGQFVVRVHDSGPGVDPGLIHEIFRDGFTTKVARQGRLRRGLGLALVHHEVTKRGGTITVENADGAVFTVALPVSALEVVES